MATVIKDNDKTAARQQVDNTSSSQSTMPRNSVHSFSPRSQQQKHGSQKQNSNKYR